MEKLYLGSKSVNKVMFVDTPLDEAEELLEQNGIYPIEWYSDSDRELRIYVGDLNEEEIKLLSEVLETPSEVVNELEFIVLYEI